MTELHIGTAAVEIFLLAAICAILLVDLFLPQSLRRVSYILSLLSLVAGAWIAWAQVPEGRELAFHGAYVLDPIARVLKLFAIGAMAAVFVYSRSYLEDRQLFQGEYYLLGLFALLGVLVMVSAGNLLSLYLGLELLTLALYALVAFNRESPTAAESAIKFFVLGAIASGCLLYGISMIYGATGTIELSGVADAVRSGSDTGILLAVGLAFVLVGIAFKFGAVPFHMWIPDVYQGAPTAVALLVGSVPKIAAFALLLRLLVDALPGMSDNWALMLMVLSVLSMLIGNIAAVAQTDVKRMLAYSTIGHMGFVLMGMVATGAEGAQAAAYYTLVYVLMSVGAFGMVILLCRQGHEATRIDDFKGLHTRSPWFAFVMLVLMFAMAGVPPMVGFHAKLAVLEAALGAGQVWLAGIGMLAAVIGAYYYLRIVWFMYFEAPEQQPALHPAGDLRAVLSVNGLLVLALGLFPGPMLSLIADVLI